MLDLHGIFDYKMFEPGCQISDHFLQKILHCVIPIHRPSCSFFNANRILNSKRQPATHWVTTTHQNISI